MPMRWTAIHKIIAVIAGLPGEIVKRELQIMRRHLAEAAAEMRALPSREGPGNAVMVELCYENLADQRLLPKALAGQTASRRLTNVWVIRQFLEEEGGLKGVCEVRGR